MGCSSDGTPGVQILILRPYLRPGIGRRTHVPVRIIRSCRDLLFPRSLLSYSGRQGGSGQGDGSVTLTENPPPSSVDQDSSVEALDPPSKDPGGAGKPLGGSHREGN